MSRLGYFVLFGLVGAFVVLRLAIGDWTGAFWSLAVLVLVSVLLLAVVGYFASNIPDWSRRLRGISWEDHLKDLEEKGKALREHYETDRAVTFEDLRTGCLVHLMDVGDRGLLCLYGQQYYDFEPIEDDPDVNQERKFPTTSFSLLRRSGNGEVLALFPGPRVLEPTVCGGIARPDTIHGLGIQLKDGELVRVPYETVEATCRSLGTRARAA